MSEIDGDKFETKWVYYQNQKFLVKNNNPLKKRCNNRRKGVPRNWPDRIRRR